MITPLLEKILISYMILFSIFILIPDLFIEWGHVVISNESNKFKPEYRWKNLSEWTFGDLLFSLIMLYAFIGMIGVMIASYILFAVAWILFLNTLSKNFWFALSNLLNKNIFKNKSLKSSN